MKYNQRSSLFSESQEGENKMPMTEHCEYYFPGFDLVRERERKVSERLSRENEGLGRGEMFLMVCLNLSL